MNQINGNTVPSLLPSTYFAPTALDEVGPVSSETSSSSLSLSAEVLPLSDASLTDGMGMPLGVADTAVLLAEVSFAFEKLIGENAAARIRSQGADRGFASLGILAGTGQVQSLEVRLELLNATLAEKQGELQEAQARLSNLTAQRNEASASLLSIDAMIAGTQLSISSINQQLAATTDPAARALLTANRDAALGSLSSLRSSRSQTLATIAMLDVEIPGAQARADALAAEVNALNAEVAATGAQLQTLAVLLPLLVLHLLALPNVTDGVLGRGQDNLRNMQVQALLEEAGSRSIDIDRAIAELDLEKDIALDLIERGDVARRLVTGALSLAEGLALLARTLGNLLAKTPAQPELPFERGNRISLAI